MTTPPALPAVPGLAWSRHKMPGFKTRVASHVSGREVRVALQQYPLYEFAATYAGMNSATSPAAALAGLGNSSLQALMGFFLQMQGQFGTFLYADPDDNTVAGGAIATGDGATATFLIPRVLGGFSEPASYVTAVTAVYLNGVAQPANSWLFTAPNSLGFVAAPGAGVAITADFTFAFQCRFLDDAMDFEEFMNALWKLDKMGFRSIKANTVPSSNVPAWYDAWMISATLPTLVADTTTEGAANNYYYNGTTYSSFAALLAALGITFSRASIAYYTNSSGLLAQALSGIARFDYDPILLTSKGLMLEKASTNLILDSQALATGSNTSPGPWNPSGNLGSITPTNNATAAPDGTTTATSLVSHNGSTSTNFYEQGFTTTASTTYTHSCYIKPLGGWTWCYLECFSGVSAVAWFNLSGSGSLGTVSGTGSPSATITQCANGWYRVTMTYTSASSGGFATGIYGVAGVPANNQKYTITGDGVSGVLAWGAQAEASPFATSYIPTTSSTASRSADSLSAATWSAITAGTLYAAADSVYASQAQRLIQVDNGTENSRATLEFNASAAGEFDFLDAGSLETALAAGTVTASTVVQLAAAFQANDFALVVNGGTPSTSSSGAVPSFSKLRLGQDSTGANVLSGHLRQFGVWNNLRGPNSALQNLT